MNARFILAPLAEQELDDQVAFIAERAGPETAARLYEAADTAFQLLARNPELGVTRDFDRPKLSGLRMWPIRGFEKHLIFYRVTERGIEVARVIHASQDVKALLLGKECDKLVDEGGL